MLKAVRMSLFTHGEHCAKKKNGCNLAYHINMHAKGPFVAVIVLLERYILFINKIATSCAHIGKRIHFVHVQQKADNEAIRPSC